MRLRAATLAASVAVTATLAVAAPAQAIALGLPPTTYGPWVAQVYDVSAGTDTYSCSGALVAADWVITARQCLPATGKTTAIRIGSTTRGQGTRIAVDRSVTPPTSGDLALLHLATPSSNQTLPVANEKPWSGYTGGVFGYASGVRGEGAACVLDGWVTDANGGAGYWVQGITGEGVKGDFGGPFEFDGKLVGVTSSLLVNEDPNRRGFNVVADVPAHRAWIKATAGV